MSFQLSPHTLKVPAALFVKNRQRLLNVLRGLVGPSTVVVLQGGLDVHLYNTDCSDLPFRQESYFFWTFGVHEPDTWGLLDVDSGKSVLLPPKLHPDFRIWEGKINPVEWFKEKYEVDEAHFHEDHKIAPFVAELGPKTLMLLEGTDSDSGTLMPAPTFEGIDQFQVEKKDLYNLMSELRCFKTDEELAVMRYSAKIACDAHKDVMKNIKPGMYEYQCESLFRHHSYFHGGCRHLAYTCIAATGTNASVLHYGHANAPNAKLIKDGDMCMFDMGPEYNCYASDVSSSFPANGKFTENQKVIYNAVLKANLAVFEAAKPGLFWYDMHMLAEKIILEELKKIGLIVGCVEEAVKARVGAVFMPHGLGHMLGLSVHDPAGHLGDAVPRSTLPGLKSCRVSRSLKERMVITIEPGCYFIDFLIDEALEDPVLSKFLNREAIAPFRGFGGIRIEDDVVIWAKGNENMSILPRTVEEIEAYMAK
uniref:AMP_N domain-containing protein n=1 Tax=Rhabditophanes sp. KR3021 TaxID=114890 RepID=A0AC35TKM6_9BILA